MKTIVQDLAVEYMDQGRGPVVLMLHGWKDSLHTFDALAPMLADKHRVVRLDLPGFGTSDMPPRAWRLDDYVDFVKAFADKLQLDIDTLIGHSLGGRITIKGVAMQVLKPRKIVLIAAAGIAKRTTGRNVFLRIVAKIGKVATAVWPLSLFRHTLRRKLYENIGSDYFVAGALKDTFLNIVGEDLQSAAAQIATPALLIWGSLDTTTPLDDGKRLHELMKGSRLEIVEGAGHFVHHEHSNQVARTIDQFI